MIRTQRPAALAAILFALMVVAVSPAHAQVQTGTPPFGSFAGGPDIINLANLNAHLDVPILNKPGRGMPFVYNLTYDTSIWTPVTSGSTKSWQPTQYFGWTGGASLGYLTNNTTITSCFTWDTSTGVPVRMLTGSQTTENHWVYHDPFGIAHVFAGQLVFITGTGCFGIETDSFSASAGDSSGYTLFANDPVLGTEVVAKDGQAVTLTNFVNTTTGNGVTTDRNGNQLSVDSSGAFKDTLGTTALTIANTTPSTTTPETLTYTAPSGASAVYKLNYAQYTMHTNFGCAGISEYVAATTLLVSEIDLPDVAINPTDKYTFTYEITPGDTHTPHYVTGRLASVTLPTGGTITYTYSGGSNGITCADGSTAGLSRTTPDGTWTYARTPGTGTAYTTTITDPSTGANQTVVQFQGIYETQRQTYQGSTAGTLLQTINTCYNGSTTPCTGTAITAAITQRTVTTSLGATTALTKKCIYSYGANGSLTEQDDYDFGFGAPGALLRKTLISFGTLGSITDFPQQTTVQNGAGTTVAQTNFTYDEGTPTATTGTLQHTSVTGSRGNLTTTQAFSSGTASLTSHTTYYDTGTPNTTTDVNGANITYVYGTGSCGNSFPTTINEPLTLSQSITWNCTGGVPISVSDENGAITSATYTTNPSFWRPDSVTDPTSAVASFIYSGQTSSEAILNFNAGASTSDTLTTVDSLGRPRVQQNRQAPGSSNFDSAESDYDALGRPSRSTLPYTGTAGQTNSTAPSVTTLYDAHSRPTMVTDAGTGFTSYAYNQNDVFITAGPAVTGENAKRRQLEYDGLGRLTSVCEITAGTTAWPAGSCGQTNAQTGYWTKYTYDAIGDLLTVTQNAQAASANQQTRTYTYDELGRLKSEANPETGSIAYTYDTDTTCGVTSSGDLVKKVDAVGNTACYAYDALHRNVGVAYTGAYSANTPNKYFVYDAATVNSVLMSNTKTRLAEAYTATSPTGTKITDVGLSYSARGDLTDVYEFTTHSGTYYHSGAQFWANGALSQLTGPGIPTITYTADGEGRVNQVLASTGTNPVTATAYNSASQPTAVTLGSTDSDAFQYDANTLRPTQYKFNVGTQAVTGNLTWNANGSLGSLGITDPFNAANTQTCNYAADDLSRIATANCGTVWGQGFTYDPLGNISKTALSGSAGTSFLPAYQASPTTNRIASLPGGFTPTYDANGNSTNDNFHQFTWDAENRPVTVVSGGGTVNLTYDAFGRMVEQARGTTYTQIVYSPLGSKLTTMTGSTLQKGFVPLTSGASAVYTSTGLAYYRHTDHLGSSRFVSTPTQTMYSDTAYSAFGEPYAQSGTTDASFTGQDQDTTAGLYDFLYRKYDPGQSRWISPDPLGIGAVDPTIPQSWNRYAYAVSDPLRFIDPLGLIIGPGAGGGSPFPPTFAPWAIAGDLCAFQESVADRDWDWELAVMCDFGGGGVGGPGPYTTGTGGPGKNQPCSVSASSLNTYLGQKKSPMTGQGTNLMNTGSQYNIDPRLFVSLAGAETGFGKNITAGQYNAFNILYNGLNSPFPSFQAAINSAGHSLTNPKNRYDLTNTSTMYNRYCSTGSTCGAGLTNVNAFMGQQGADINSLHFPCKKD